jgi:hypothetical protein
MLKYCFASIISEKGRIPEAQKCGSGSPTLLVGYLTVRFLSLEFARPPTSVVDQDPGRIGIILQDRDRHPDPERYQFQPNVKIN